MARRLKKITVRRNRNDLYRNRGFLLSDFSLKNKTMVKTISHSGFKIFSPMKQKITQSLPSVPVPRVQFVSTSAICRARKIRREVLFAKGRNGGKHKPPTFSLKSLVRCN